MSNIFGGFAPKESIYLLLLSDSFLGADFLEILTFFGALPLGSMSFNTHFTSVVQQPYWQQCNRPITGVKGSY
jgi:hypothetical protein